MRETDEAETIMAVIASALYSPLRSMWLKRPNRGHGLIIGYSTLIEWDAESNCVCFSDLSMRGPFLQQMKYNS